VPRPSEVEYQKLTWLLTHLRESEDYCRPYFERAKTHYKLYRFSTAIPEKDWPYVNRVRSRDIMAFVEDTTAILIQTLFATTPFFSVIPRESTSAVLASMGIDMYKIGQQVERCLDYQISHEDTDFLEEIIDYFKSGKIFGTSYIGVYPRFEIDGAYRLPMLKNRDFWDVLPIVGSKRLSHARGAFIREFCTLDDLKGLKDAQGQSVYRNLDQLDKAGTGSGNDPSIEWHKNLLQEVGMTTYITSGNDIEVLHYFSGGHVITIANRRVILRDSTEMAGPDGQIVASSQTPYPYNMPEVQFKDVPIPNEFFGMGIPEIIEVLQEDKNLVRSARRDNIDLCINKILLTKEGADVNIDLLKFYPGAIWPETLGKVEGFEIGDVTQSSYAEEKQIQADMENALSLFGYARGMTPAHSEQPNTVMKLQQASLNRQDIAVKLAEFTVLQEIARKIVMLNRTYMRKEDYEAIIGEKDAGFYTLPAEYINRFYAIKPVGSSVTHIKEIRQAQIDSAAQFIAQLASVPGLMQQNIEPFTVNWYALARTKMDTADIKNIDQILVKLQPQQQQTNPIMAMMTDPNVIAQLSQVQYGGGNGQPPPKPPQQGGTSAVKR
jgi:hypothetical protein